MVFRPYINLTREEVEKIRNNPSNKGYQPEMDAIAELEFRDAKETMAKLQSDVQKLTNPHWTRNWTFWVALGAFLVALLQYFLPLPISAPDKQHKIVSLPATTTTSHLQSEQTSTQKKSQHKPVQKKP